MRKLPKEVFQELYELFEEDYYGRGAVIATQGKYFDGIIIVTSGRVSVKYMEHSSLSTSGEGNYDPAKIAVSPTKGQPLMTPNKMKDLFTSSKGLDGRFSPGIPLEGQKTPIREVQLTARVPRKSTDGDPELLSTATTTTTSAATTTGSTTAVDASQIELEGEEFILSDTFGSGR